jgi:hypothetical protein
MMTPDVQTDDCTRVPWLRRSPIINEEGYNVSYPRFELGMETGVGRPLGDLADPTCAVTPVLPVPDEACGALTGDIEFVWEHNSRVGPFMGTERGEIFFIGRDPNDEKRLVVAKTTNFGEEWALVDDVFPVLTNNILSFDCHDKDTENGDLDYILVGTQEAVGSGRVACHIFSKITSTWTLLDSQVVASAAIMAGGANDNGGCVSMTVLANGNFGCMYDTDPEDVGGTDYFRYGFRISTDSGATWSAEEQEEQAGIAWHFVCARAIADNDGRVQLGSGNSVSPGFGHYTFQTRRADGSYSVVTVTFEGGALSQVQQGRCIGDYCTWEEGGSTKIAVPGRTLEDARYAIFTSVDDMILEDVNQAVTGTTFMASGTALYPQTAMSFAGGLLHIMGNKFDNSVPTWTWHKSIESPYMTPTPSGAEEDQAGPIYSILGEGIPEQELAAKVVEMDGETYFVTLRRSGTAGLGLVFNWIKTSLLPTSDAFTIGEWSEACPTANVPASDPTSELPWADDLTLSPEFDPLIYLKYSNDWGKSWSNELYRSIGKSGQYSKQLIWDRLGSGRQRVFEIGSSAAVPIAIDEAYIGEPEALKR